MGNELLKHVQTYMEIYMAILISLKINIWVDHIYSLAQPKGHQTCCH